MNHTKETPPPIPVANKSLGQHYLNNQNVIDHITSDWSSQSEYILEVGPGPAVLTQKLKLHQRPLHVIEKDSRFVPQLKEHLTGDQILITDALEIEFALYLNSMDWNKNVWLVSNLPYNVGVPLMINFFKAPQVKYLTLMMQKEVGEKIFNWTQRKTTKLMGPLMALSHNYFTIEHRCNVAPACFSPPPKVDSVVLSFERKENPKVEFSDFDYYQKYLRILFSKRRKQMANVIKNSFVKDKFEEVLLSRGKKLSDRAETLTIDDCAEIFNQTHKEGQLFLG